MLSEKEYSICLIRLTLPPEDLTSKMTLSVKNLFVQNFISKPKTVKSQKVHFYRQILFLSKVSQGITFNIYSLSFSNQKRFVKALEIGSEELESIDKRAAMFHTKVDGYELVWQCCVFNAHSELENQETDREYSQFKVAMDSQCKELHLISNQSRVNSIKNGKADPKTNKRSTSAQSSSFRNESIRDDAWSKSSKKSRRVKDDSDSPQKSENFGQNNGENGKGIKKLFSYFRGGISNLFSSARI